MAWRFLREWVADVVADGLRVVAEAWRMSPAMPCASIFGGAFRLGSARLAETSTRLNLWADRAITPYLIQPEIA